MQGSIFDYRFIALDLIENIGSASCMWYSGPSEREVILRNFWFSALADEFVRGGIGPFLPRNEQGSGDNSSRARPVSILSIFQGCVELICPLWRMTPESRPCCFQFFIMQF